MNFQHKPMYLSEDFQSVHAGRARPNAASRALPVTCTTWFPCRFTLTYLPELAKRL